MEQAERTWRVARTRPDGKRHARLAACLTLALALMWTPLALRAAPPGGGSPALGQPGEALQPVLDALIARARAGIAVRILLDATFMKQSQAAYDLSRGHPGKAGSARRERRISPYHDASRSGVALMR